MTLDELKQIKDSLDKGVIVSKATWLRVLDAAIEGKLMSRELGQYVVGQIFDR